MLYSTIGVGGLQFFFIILDISPIVYYNIYMNTRIYEEDYHGKSGTNYGSDRENPYSADQSS
jgi:hypothetical protein